MKVGIVGCGAIGSEVARAASAMEGVSAILLFDIDPDATTQLRNLPRTKVARSAKALVESCDLVIECANKGVVQTVVRDALGKGKKAMLLTIGGRYFTFATLYGLKLYWICSGTLAAAGFALAALGADTAVIALTGGMLELIFAASVFVKSRDGKGVA